MKKHITDSFKKSSLPQTGFVQRAYEMVKEFPRAVESAQRLAEASASEVLITAHMLAFVPTLTSDDIEEGFSCRVAEIVKGTNDIYDLKVAPPYNGYSKEVIASFMACAIYDLDTILAESQNIAISDPILLTYKKPDRVVFVETTLEDHLKETRRDMDAKVTSLLGKTGLPQLEARFLQSMQDLERKINAPEKPTLKTPAPKHKAPKP